MVLTAYNNEPLLEKNPVKKDTPVDISALVQNLFPKIPTEFRADYCPVGTTCFRINFWSRKSNEGGSLSQGSFISRSLFVHMEQDEDGKFRVGKIFEN